MLPSEGGGDEGEAAPIDVKSRIAAFSQTASASSRPAPAISKVSKPTLRKTPSTSQLLPAWQQHQQLERQKKDEPTSHDAFLKPNSASSSRPRAHTGDESRLTAGSGEKVTGNSPKLGVKGIIALYGQQTQTSNSIDSSPDLQSRSREVSSEGALLNSSSMETIRRAVPPPALPPRPRNLLSQTNTGSSDHSTTSNGPSTSAAGASPSSSYVPYIRKGNGNSQLSAGSTNGADSPGFPKRPGGAHSVGSSSIDESSHPSQLSSAMRKLGSGPKWASSSSGNLTTQGETSRSQSPTIPPAVPPRASASVTNSPSASFVPPPPKRTVPLQSPASARNHQRSMNAASYSTSVPSSTNLAAAAAASASTMTASLSNGQSARSAKSSLATPISSSPILAPPPRHVDTIRRMDTRNLVSASSSSSPSLRSARKEKRKRFKALQASAVYARDPGDAEQRYTLLFYRRLKDQQARTGGDSSLLNKRTVVRIWKQSQLEDWFLANVWEAAAAATASEGGGVGRAAFTRAMSAIDFELSRRQTERQSHSLH